MDPVIFTVVTSLAAGATAIAQGVATAVGEDIYLGLKRLISDRYNKAAPFVEAVEANPGSQPEQQVLARQLDQVGAAQDKGLAEAAQALLDAIARLRGEPRAEALFDFDQLRIARNMQLKDIIATQVMRVRGVAEIEGDLTAENIRQTASSGPPEKN